MQWRSACVLLGLAAISQGATCHPPLLPVASYMPVAPAMRPAGSVSVSAVGGGGIGRMGPRFDEPSAITSSLTGGAARVEVQPLDGVSFALSGGVISPLGSALGDLPFRGAAHGLVEARFRIATQHAAFVGAGGGVQAWAQDAKTTVCPTSPCMTRETPFASVLTPIASLHAGFGATWIRSAPADWYSNFSLGMTYGNAFVVSPPASAPTVRVVPDWQGSLLVSMGVRITLWSAPSSRVRWSLLIDAAALGRTEPLAAGVFTIGTSVDFDRALAVRDDGVRRLERD